MWSRLGVFFPYLDEPEDRSRIELLVMLTGANVGTTIFKDLKKMMDE